MAVAREAAAIGWTSAMGRMPVTFRLRAGPRGERYEEPDSLSIPKLGRPLPPRRECTTYSSGYGTRGSYKYATAHGGPESGSTITREAGTARTVDPRPDALP